MYLSTTDRFIRNVWVYVVCAYYIPVKKITSAWSRIGREERCKGDIIRPQQWVVASNFNISQGTFATKLKETTKACFPLLQSILLDTTVSFPVKKRKILDTLKQT